MKPTAWLSLAQLADALQVGHDAVHGEYAVRRDQLDPRAGRLCLLQATLQIGHVVVLVAIAPGLAKPHAVNDAGMVERVGDDRILGAQQRLKQAAVGVEAGRIEDRVVHAQKLRNLALKLLVHALRAADEAHGGQSIAPYVVALLGRADDLRVIRQAQIVVGAHVEHALRLRRVDAAALGRRDDALVLIGAVRPALLDRLAVQVQSRLSHAALPFRHLAWRQSSTTLPHWPLFMTAKPFSKSS